MVSGKAEPAPTGSSSGNVPAVSAEEIGWRKRPAVPRDPSANGPVDVSPDPMGTGLAVMFL